MAIDPQTSEAATQESPFPEIQLPQSVPAAHLYFQRTKYMMLYFVCMPINQDLYVVKDIVQPTSRKVITVSDWYTSLEAVIDGKPHFRSLVKRPQELDIDRT